MGRYFLHENRDTLSGYLRNGILDKMLDRVREALSETLD